MSAMSGFFKIFLTITEETKVKNTILLLIAFLTTCGMIPDKSMAELKGDVTGGVSVVNIDDESFKYGEYTGVKDNGMFLNGNAGLQYDRELYYLKFSAQDIGLDSRRLYLEKGRYGKFRVFLGYDELPRLISGNSRTPFEGAGGDTLTLPAGFVMGTTTTAMTNLSSDLKDIDLELKRKTWTLGFSEYFNRNLNFSVSYDRGKKEGTKSIGGTVGTGGGNGSSVVLPEPVDYTTEELKTSIAYNNKVGQIQLDYFLSYFTNDVDSFTWENPYNTATFPTTARISLPPDNIHQRFSLSGGMNLSSNTRINISAEYGKMEQDEALLPYSNNVLSTITTPLPRDSAKAEIDVKALTMNVSFAPVSRLGLNARYRYYSTENKTPRDLFQYVKNDTGAAQAAVTDSHALYNLPYDYIQNQLKMDASYYLFTGTSLKAGYDHEVVERDFREIAKTNENTYRAALQSRYIPYANIGFNVSLAVRKAEDIYSESNLYDEYHTEDYINSLSAAVRFDNHPLLRKFDIANRNRTKFGANTSFFLADNATLGIYYNTLKDDYDISELGLQFRNNTNYTVDAAYSPSEPISLYAFYTREFIDSRQDSRSYSGGGNKVTQSSDPNRNWSAEHDDNVDTLGLGASFGFMDNRIVINTDYSFTVSDTSIRYTAGSALTAPTDMPKLKTNLQTLDITGKYRFKKSLTLGASYQYENYRSDNWQTDGVAAASAIIANVITLSDSTPDYEAHQGMLFLTYHFGANDI